MWSASHWRGPDSIVCNIIILKLQLWSPPKFHGEFLETAQSQGNKKIKMVSTFTLQIKWLPVKNQLSYEMCYHIRVAEQIPSKYHKQRSTLWPSYIAKVGKHRKKKWHLTGEVVDIRIRRLAVSGMQVKCLAIFERPGWWRTQAIGYPCQEAFLQGR